MHPAVITSRTKSHLLRTDKIVTLLRILRMYADDDKTDDKSDEKPEQKPNKKAEIELPPEPTTCCMSGCANCVWIEYAQTISKLLDGNDEKAREIILQKISDPNLRMFLSVELKNLQHNRDNKGKK